MSAIRKNISQPEIYVEFYRASKRDVRDLKRYLRSYEAVKAIRNTGRISELRELGFTAVKTSPTNEMGEIFTIWVLPVLVNYAGTKILQIVEDRVKDWFRTHGRDEQFITLSLSTGSTQRKIGKGKPKRYQLPGAGKRLRRPRVKNQRAAG